LPVLKYTWPTTGFDGADPLGCKAAFSSELFAKSMFTKYFAIFCFCY
jgi:hypothetical protein